MLKHTKSIAYAYPTSTNAKTLGFEATGCWHIQVTAINIENSGQACTYLPHDAEGYITPDDEYLIAQFKEEKGNIDPSFIRFGNEKAKEALGI